MDEASAEPGAAPKRESRAQRAERVWAERVAASHASEKERVASLRGARMKETTEVDRASVRELGEAFLGQMSAEAQDELAEKLNATSASEKAAWVRAWLLERTAPPGGRRR